MAVKINFERLFHGYLITLFPIPDLYAAGSSGRDCGCAPVPPRTTGLLYGRREPRKSCPLGRFGGTQVRIRVYLPRLLSGLEWEI